MCKSISVRVYSLMWQHPCGSYASRYTSSPPRKQCIFHGGGTCLYRWMQESLSSAENQTCAFIAMYLYWGMCCVDVHVGLDSQMQICTKLVLIQLTYRHLCTVTIQPMCYVWVLFKTLKKIPKIFHFLQNSENGLV